MDKYKLKERIIKAYEQLHVIYGELASPACATNEVGELRAEALQALRKAGDELHRLQRNIY